MPAVEETNHLPVGLLKPLQNPDGNWASGSINFIVDLPTTVSGYDVMLVVVDHFSNFVRFLPLSSKAAAADVARLFL